jgi:hypothetical protein
VARLGSLTAPNRYTEQVVCTVIVFQTKATTKRAEKLDTLQ